MDRFGDDLTEEILQYLTLEDKIRLECVSKQLQRCVFNKQFVIEILIRNTDPNEIKKCKISFSELKNQSNEHIFESVLKKFQNITKVCLDFKVDGKVLSLIGQYCPHIKSLKYYIDESNDEMIMSFYR